MKPFLLLRLFGLSLPALFLSACGEVLIDESEIYAKYASDKTGFVAVTDIILDPTEITIPVHGAPVQITAAVLPENATNKEILWTSLTPNIAMVDAAGWLIPASSGSAVIMAAIKGGGGGKYAFCFVTVVDETEAVPITDTNLNSALLPPLIGAATEPITTHYNARQWSVRSVTWKTADGAPVSVFEAGTPYTVSIILIRNSGWTFNGMDAASFTYTGVPGALVSSGTMLYNGTGFELDINVPAMQQTNVTTAIGGAPSLIEQLNWIKENGEYGENYLVVAARNETIAPYTLDVRQDNKLSNIGIMLKSAGGEYTIQSDGNNTPLFTLSGFNSQNKLTFILDANVHLRGNAAYNNTPVSANNYAAFIMNAGSTISNGGKSGVRIVTASTFIMNGGKIRNNATVNYADYGGGVYITDNSTFTMNGGEIFENTSDNHGGGVYISSATFIMNDGEITNNGSSYYGGGVYNSGFFTMNNGTISGNQAQNNGGGVYNSGSSFIMNGGTISSNRTIFDGGGVYCQYSSFFMNGGTMSGNRAGSTGGGVFFLNGPAGTGQFVKTGNSIIYGNTDNTHTEGSPENTAEIGAGNAVMCTGGGITRKRDSTAGAGVFMSTELLGGIGGWE